MIPQELGDCERGPEDDVDDDFEPLAGLVEELIAEPPAELLAFDGDPAGTAVGVEPEPEPEPEPSLELELELEPEPDSPPVFGPAPSLAPGFFDVASARESLR